MSGADLGPLRRQIDALDRELVRLLNERARLGIEVGRAKVAAGLDVHDAEREAEVLRRVRETNAATGGPITDEALLDLYRRIIELTRQIEQAEAGTRPPRAPSGGPVEVG